MGCKAFDVVYVEQGGQNESKIFRTLDSQGKTIIKGNYHFEFYGNLDIAAIRYSS